MTVNDVKSDVFNPQGAAALDAPRDNRQFTRILI